MILAGLQCFRSERQTVLSAPREESKEQMVVFLLNQAYQKISVT